MLRIDSQPCRSLLVVKNLQHETLQPQRVNTLELYWQDVIVWWTQMEPNTKINIWLGGASGLFCAKQFYPIIFLKQNFC
jgi:hypothetical protein